MLAPLNFSMSCLRWPYSYKKKIYCLIFLALPSGVVFLYDFVGKRDVQWLFVPKFNRHCSYFIFLKIRKNIFLILMLLIFFVPYFGYKKHHTKRNIFFLPNHVDQPDVFADVFLDQRLVDFDLQIYGVTIQQNTADFQHSFHVANFFFVL